MIEESPSSVITYSTVSSIAGPLLFVKNIKGVAYGELVHVLTPDGEKRTGQVLEAAEDIAVVQVFEGTQGLDTRKTSVRFLGETIKIAVSQDMLGRIFSGSGKAIDAGPQIFAEERLDITGAPINPYSREYPREFIQTGISSIDGLNTLIRGQKLPIFSGSGLPHNNIAAQIARQSTVLGKDEEFAVIFAAMGITTEEARFFREDFEKTGALERVILFLNLADSPAAERLITPRIALSVAEYLAFEYDYHCLVILTDMTNYAEALREISAAREEVPGRRGYPGYLYTDLATIYERAGRIKGHSGTITQLPILSMPSDDITHPIPDLSGYITEGQLIVDRDLNRRGIYPPIDPMPSLSRLMREGIGRGRTHVCHKPVADQMFAGYSLGRNLRDLVAVVGEESLSATDKKYLRFADRFESEFLRQGYYESREIFDTLELAWDLLSDLPEEELKRIPPKLLQKYHPKYRTSKLAIDDPEP
ncbi:V-type ATP synthase subunit B [Candidatus Heimdallarchaeota archaeon B3_Heim]|nr:MAG: V-type ATP synthase subunit B [Candidatus Heimdallarchaeota archaeon B3_Heim]